MKLKKKTTGVIYRLVDSQQWRQREATILHICKADIPHTIINKEKKIDCKWVNRQHNIE